MTWELFVLISRLAMSVGSTVFFIAAMVLAIRDRTEQATFAISVSIFFYLQSHPWA